MRPRFLLPVLLLGVGLLTPALVRVPAAETAGAARVAKLVEQLGSGDFGEREKASKELDDIGAPALEALHRAASSEDAEVRRRAEELVRKIEKRTASARILAPTRVHLVYRDTPLPEAVADFKKKSGYDIALHDPRGKLADRKITLDTGETTFWHALDLFCREAGLRQAGPQNLVAAAGPGLPGAFPPNQPQFGGGRGRGRPQAAPQPALPGAAQPAARARRIGGGMPAGQVPGQITLIEGRPRALPTDDTCAVRIRAVDGAGGQAPEGQALLSLEIAPEPKLQWQQLVSVRIVRATDDQGQELSQVGDATVAPALGVIGGGRVLRGAVALAQPAVGGPPVLWNGPYPQTLVHLKKGERPAKSLKEVAGLLDVQVLTESRPLLTADNVLAAAGKSFKGKEGGSITVNEVLKGKDGQVTIRYQVQPPPDVLPAGNPVPGARRAAALPMQAFPAVVGGPVQVQMQVQIIQAQIQLQRQAQVQVIMRPGGAMTANNGVRLVDQKGEALPTSTTVNLRQKGAALEPEYELVYRPQKGRGEPARLVFYGRKSAAIDIPFTLKNVPLP
jgi:hypothetical protein